MTNYQQAKEGLTEQERQDNLDIPFEESRSGKFEDLDDLIAESMLEQNKLLSEGVKAIQDINQSLDRLIDNLDKIK